MMPIFRTATDHQAMTSILRPILICAALGTTLVSTGCLDYVNRPWVYKIDVQQGNIITQDMVNQLRPGMTQNQVRYALGSPMLVDVFHQERWDYVYRLEPGGGESEQRRVSLYFQDGLLSRLEGDYRPLPPSIAEAAPTEAEEAEVVVPEGAGKAKEKGFFKGVWDDLFGDDEPEKVEIVVEEEENPTPTDTE